MFKQSKLFFWTIEILAVTALIFLLSKIGFVFRPVQTMLALLFIPIIIAAFLYYVFHPVVKFMERRLKIKQVFSILIILLLLGGGLILVIATIIPSIISQLNGVINTTTHVFPQIRTWVEHQAHDPRFAQLYNQLDVNNMINNLNLSYTDILQNILDSITVSVGSIVGVVVSVVTIMILVPIFLYYMLKDGHKLVPFLRENVFKEDKWGMLELLGKMNHTISRYISGIALDAGLVFVCVFIGYLVLGIPYAFIFALFAGITNLIPYAGPYIGVIPVIVTVAFNHPWLALIAVIYVLALQQLDGNLVYPRIIGNAVRVHPVTVMVLMLVSGSLYGILGMIIAIPVYSLVKEIVKFLVALYQNIKEQRQSKIKMTDEM